jgi:hypothetical protein
VATNPRSWAFRDYVVEHRNLSGTPGRSLALVAMHRPLLSRYAPTQEKKPTREPTIASCRVAWCLISFRGPQQICGSNRLNATRWDSRRRHGTTEIALRIRRLQVRFLPSAPNKSRSECIQETLSIETAPNENILRAKVLPR